MLVQSVLHYLQPKPHGTYVDCTVGGGGHAQAIMDHVGGRCRFVGIDRDPQAVAAAGRALESFGDAVTIVQGNFRDLSTILDRLMIEHVDGILVDLGVSSHQLDTEERGFSYWEGTLDMRMGPDAHRTAAELIRDMEEEELAHILHVYGEERWAKRIAGAIVRRRRQKPIDTAPDLSEVIKGAIPAAARRKGPHPARRIFQALRIAVNDEMGALNDLLSQAVDRLVPGGRFVAISFHSLEDRMVKQAMAGQAKGCICPPEIPVCTCENRPKVKVLTRRPIVADPEEIETNPRARSAKLRAVEKVLS